MNKYEIISVIVPVYNVGKYLRECLDSIVNQTYKNLEIILVDDGSLDDSGKICDEYAEKDSRIKVIHKENGGVSDARNVGMEISTGEYIFFVDSDDYIEKNAIKEFVGIAERENADIVIANNVFFRDCEVIRENINNKGKEVYSKEQAAEHYASFDWGAWNKLFRKEVHESILFPKGKIHEDEAIMFQLIANSNKIVHIERTLYYYRKRGGSITEQNYSTKKMDWYYAWKDNVKFVKGKFPNAYEQVLGKWLMVAIYNFDNLLKRNLLQEKKYISEIRAAIRYYSNDIIMSRRINSKKKIRTILLSYGSLYLYKKIYRI